MMRLEQTQGLLPRTVGIFCTSQAAIHAGSAQVSLRSIWKSLLSEKGTKTKPKDTQKQNKNNKRTRGRRLLKVLLSVHAWVRQRVKKRLGKELKQKGHEIGHPRRSTKCLLARHDTCSIGLLKQAMSSSTTELCSLHSFVEWQSKKTFEEALEGARAN